ncbi:MAG TPA: endonuclease/exonuclease/phosphatase family protein [Ferrovibrio sp.]|uniref:endonuclease/exonuclease/phosphatase family protein n=1 Tax=Ferrovibrio sp. TaxID=1917215 RepID=UPI002ED07327
MNLLRVATYNIHSCIGGDRSYDPPRILKVLREIDADILALQEVGGYPVDGQEQVHYFERHLGMTLIPGLNLRRRRVQFGNALLVRGQVEIAEQVNLTVSRLEPRSAIDATVETRLGSLRVIATHLGLLPRDRRRQIAIISTLLDRGMAPLTLLMGDFNVFGPERAVLHQIGAPRPLPKLRSFPARRPLMSLDRLWTLPNENLSALHLHRTPLSAIASDHLPLVGEMAIPVPQTEARAADKDAELETMTVRSSVE